MPSGYSLDTRNVDDAGEKVLRIIRVMGGKKVIYFHGWSGLGASAVLRYIAEVVPSRRSTPELCFDRVIHLDCSDWKSRRALQRKIAEELELDSTVMAILDKQDEEDDFRGVGESSRKEIVSVSRKINQILEYSRFMVIYHSGSYDEINLDPFGVPPFGEFTRNVLIWTCRRRIFTIKEVDHELVQKIGYNYQMAENRILFDLTSGQFYELICREAAIIVSDYECMRGVNPMMVTDCCLYKLFLQCSFNTTKSGFTGLTSNYWRCDGILQDDITQEASNTLHRQVRWECDDDVYVKLKKYFKLPFLVVKDDVYEEGPYRWISITSSGSEVRGMQTIPAKITSFFLSFRMSDHTPVLQNGFFEHSSNLGVLILRYCAFNFASPPFLKCQSLRFLGLDHCTDNKTGEGEDHMEWAFLCCLLVLDLCCTKWNDILSLEKMDLMTNLMELSIGVWCWQYMSRLHWRLPNLQRFRIIKPMCGPEVSTDPSKTKLENNFLLDKTKLEILDLSGNNDMKILPSSLSKASSLQVLVLDGCNGLENVVLDDGLPQSLKSFSFDGYGPASHWAPTVELPQKHERPSTAEENKCASISKISLAGCTQLENLFVRGLDNLVELDLSRTAIKILDFETMVLRVPALKRLFLLGCEHLRAITWSETDFKLDLLCIDTRAGTDCSRPSIDQNESFQLQVHAILADARFARSLWYPVKDYKSSVITAKDVYVNILFTSSPVYSGSIQLEETYKETKKNCLQQFVPVGWYIDVHSMVGDAMMQFFPKPPTNQLDAHIEIAEGSNSLRSALDEYPPMYIFHFSKSLHVHDVSISGNIDQRCLSRLKQCRMERCPKLDFVFYWASHEFNELETFWGSDLLMARWVWSKSSPNDRPLRNLKHLHLRSCPRLHFVLPVRFSLPSLETLHIIHCGDLKHIFVLDEMDPEKKPTQGTSFPNLITIHLHDLLVLREICEVGMVAPALQSIKVRGCWGLRRLPVVGPRRSGRVKKPTVEIEKDIWDALEWHDGHHPDHFDALVHSRYYKKKLPRVSLLR